MVCGSEMFAGKCGGSWGRVTGGRIRTFIQSHEHVTLIPILVIVNICTVIVICKNHIHNLVIPSFKFSRKKEWKEKENVGLLTQAGQCTQLI